VPIASLSDAKDKKVRAMMHSLAGPISEADTASEEVYADAWAVTQWSSIFDQPTPKSIVEQVLGYAVENLGRIEKAGRQIRKIAPAAMPVVQQDLQRQAEIEIQKLKDLQNP
jgi:hypothetical protein